jgi:hypothetical protein
VLGSGRHRWRITRKLCAGCGKSIHRVLGHATKVEKAFARFYVDGLARFSAGHGLGFVDRYSHALWKQRGYQAPGQVERAARHLSKYVSKERAADWLREKDGQRVFYVAPW